MRCSTRLVAEPDLLGRRREVLALGDLRVRVGFDAPRRCPLRRAADRCARSRSARARGRRACRGAGSPRPCASGRSFAGPLSMPYFFWYLTLHFTRSVAIRLAPSRHVREEQLPDRQRLQRLVAEDADVELAALDVLLDDGGGADALVDERDALLQLLVAVDDRRLRDADRRFLRQRLHDQRERQPLGPADRPADAERPRTPAPGCGDRRAASSTATCRAPAAGRADCSRCRAASAARGG